MQHAVLRAAVRYVGGGVLTDDFILLGTQNFHNLATGTDCEMGVSAVATKAGRKHTTENAGFL